MLRCRGDARRVKPKMIALRLKHATQVQRILPQGELSIHAKGVHLLSLSSLKDTASRRSNRRSESPSPQQGDYSRRAASFSSCGVCVASPLPRH